jgi:hypothetical protein
MAVLGQSITFTKGFASMYVIPDKLIYAAPSIIGVIIVGGTRKEYTDYVSYYLARAWYSKLGVIEASIVSNPWGGRDGTIHPVNAAPIGVAKAA